MTDVQPALTSDEWRERGFRDGRRDQEVELPEDNADVWVSTWWGAGGSAWFAGEQRHKMAAFCLYGQPFGFSREDVEVLLYEADDLQEASVDHPSEQRSQEMFENSFKLRDLAHRIACLLPPASPSGTEEGE